MPAHLHLLQYSRKEDILEKWLFLIISVMVDLAKISLWFTVNLYLWWWVYVEWRVFKVSLLLATLKKWGFPLCFPACDIYQEVSVVCSEISFISEIYVAILFLMTKTKQLFLYTPGFRCIIAVCVSLMNHSLSEPCYEFLFMYKIKWGKGIC